MKISLLERCGSSDLASRTRAAKLRNELVEAVFGGELVVTIDCKGIRTLAGSFADELFAVLAVGKGGEWFKRHVKVENLTDETRQSVVEAIAEREEHWSRVTRARVQGLSDCL